MGFNLGDTFPNFQAEAAGHEGKFDWYQYIGDSWAILFSHPADYTPVCTTELAKAAKMMDTFKKLNCKVAALSCDSKESHEGWTKDICEYAKCQKVNYPIIADPDRSLATKLGIMDPSEKDKSGNPVTCRSVFFINPEKKVAASLLYPASSGRSFDEILRVLVSLQRVTHYPIATPEGWKCGDKCVVDPKLSDEEAKSKLPKGVEHVKLCSGKNYLRMTPDPMSCS